ncbi:MAG: hypothetical protein H7Y19_02895 [Luteimonas sp.]|nr:hypothetical protein [Luteimonas sp.]
MEGAPLVSPDVIGWAASAVLVLTLSRQIYTQANDDTARGVSRWLFIGQILASVGFVVYSWLVHNWVFIVTNSIILLTAIVGQIVVGRKARSNPRP